MIDKTIEFIETVIGRKLTKEEILVVGLSFQSGYKFGYNSAKKEDK